MRRDVRAGVSEKEWQRREDKGRAQGWNTDIARDNGGRLTRKEEKIK